MACSISKLKIKFLHCYYYTGLHTCKVTILLLIYACCTQKVEKNLKIVDALKIIIGYYIIDDAIPCHHQIDFCNPDGSDGLGTFCNQLNMFKLATSGNLSQLSTQCYVPELT